MSTSIVLTVVSDDHPGIVESLSQVLANHGGSWEESSMMSLAGKFAGILLARLPAEQTDPFLLFDDFRNDVPDHYAFTVSSRLEKIGRRLRSLEAGDRAVRPGPPPAGRVLPSAAMVSILTRNWMAWPRGSATLARVKRTSSALVIPRRKPLSITCRFDSKL